MLGIDQGGTKTAAALMGMDGRIYGVGYGMGAYFPVQGMEAAMVQIQKAAKQAVRQAGSGLPEYRSCDSRNYRCGLAGGCKKGQLCVKQLVSEEGDPGVQ